MARLDVALQRLATLQNVHTDVKWTIRNAYSPSGQVKFGLRLRDRKIEWRGTVAELAELAEDGRLDDLITEVVGE